MNEKIKRNCLRIFLNYVISIFIFYFFWLTVLDEKKDLQNVY